MNKLIITCVLVLSGTALCAVTYEPSDIYATALEDKREEVARAIISALPDGKDKDELKASFKSDFGKEFTPFGGGKGFEWKDSSSKDEFSKFENLFDNKSVDNAGFKAMEALVKADKTKAKVALQKAQTAVGDAIKLTT